MRRHHRSLGSAVVALALVAGSALPAVADPGDIVSTDFDDGTLGPWTQSGDPVLAVVDLDGGKVLSVEGRSTDFDGIQTPPGFLAHLEPGSSYEFSMRARLAPGVPGPVGVRFVVKPDYTWVGNTTMTSDDWTTVSGSFTVPPAADPATLQVYLGTADLAPAAPYGYLVDDIRITGAAGGSTPTPDPAFVPGGAVDPVEEPVVAAQGGGNVAALTFDDGPNGQVTAELLDYLAANRLHATFCVIGQNVEAPGGADLLRRMVAEGHTLCNHSTDYADMGALTPAEAEQKMKDNLIIIRTALGDPQARVPFFRAPNGSWGQTAPVAVALGMQPLAVVNTIGDWETQDVATLTPRLRAAMKPGEVVLTHDGGGDRTGTLTAVRTVVDERLGDGWTFSLPVGAPTDAPPTTGSLVFDFEDGLQGWAPRGDAAGEPTVEVTASDSHGGAQSAIVTDRTSQGDGIGIDLTGRLTAGSSYDFTAWVRFAAGQPAGAVWLSRARTTAGASSFDTLAQFTGVTAGGWTQVTATFPAVAADSTLLYLETDYNGTNTSDFLLDDVTITERLPDQVQNLLPIRDTVDFPVGVAIDSRETTGGAAELTKRHFDQLTSENYMKPEAWYDENRAFRANPEVDNLMTFAQQNDLNVYGHTLVWHSQTPTWFFDDANGAPLTTSPADQQVLRDRMRTHIFAVAESLSTQYGDFGSDTNPLYAFDVVNEVINDSGEFSDGLRRSEWYRILGEGFIDLAFQYADEAFNDEYAAAGAEHPVTLFINDYNTEQGGKQTRMHDLLERLLSRGVPVDGLGHQFHVSLATPVTALGTTLDYFADLGLTQAVTELDVTTGVPETDARFIEQGYYYRDAFRAFRERSDDLFSVTVWGLTDGRSWRADSGGPLAFDDRLQAKPAYYGIVDAELPDRLRTANVFAGDIPLDDDAVDAPDWKRLPLNNVEDIAGFQLRWSPDHLTAYVEVADETRNGSDAVEFAWGDETSRIARDGSGDADAVVISTSAGYRVVARLPLPEGTAEGSTVSFDLRVTDGEDTIAWNSPGATGTLSLVEALSYVEVPQSTAPVIDGETDAAWAAASPVTTDTPVEGSAGASAEVRTLWADGELYVLFEVSDPEVDVSGSDPWTQDSVELFLDAGNYKNGSYRYDDTQLRISAQNTVSVGTGDEAFQLNRLQSATRVVDGGYVVEAAVSLLEDGGARHLPRHRLPGQRRVERRTHLDPHLGRPDRRRLSVDRALGRRRAGRDGGRVRRARPDPRSRLGRRGRIGAVLALRIRAGRRSVPRARRGARAADRGVPGGRRHRRGGHRYRRWRRNGRGRADRARRHDPGRIRRAGDRGRAGCRHGGTRHHCRTRCRRRGRHRHRRAAGRTRLHRVRRRGAGAARSDSDRARCGSAGAPAQAGQGIRPISLTRRRPPAWPRWSPLSAASG